MSRLPFFIISLNLKIKLRNRRQILQHFFGGRCVEWQHRHLYLEISSLSFILEYRVYIKGTLRYEPNINRN